MKMCSPYRFIFTQVKLILQSFAPEVVLKYGRNISYVKIEILHVWCVEV